VYRKISIVIPCLNEGNHVQETVESIHKTIGLNEYGVVVVNSGGTETAELMEDPLVQVFNVPRKGAPQSRNFGASKSDGDLLLFIDGHMQFSQDWGRELLSVEDLHDSIIAPCIYVKDHPDCSANGFRWNNLQMSCEWLPQLVSSLHEIPFAGGACILMEKDLFYDIGQFDDGLRLWGEEDSELCIRAWLLGYRVLCFPKVKVGHLFRSSHPYPVQWSDVVYNRIRLAFSHFTNPRLSSNLRALQSLPGFNDALLDVIEGDAMERRLTLSNKRVHDDSWFFSKFPMDGW